MPETESTQHAGLDAPTTAVVNALYPNETLDEIPPTPCDIRVQTARQAIGAYLAAMTPQPPAAPETETDANGLTDAERDRLHDAVFAEGYEPAWNPVLAEVERIVAERVRVVEAERDAAQRIASALRSILSGGGAR
ncbi:hypothetical protein [Nocardioides lacusdianchii]|uniref:hypothetical protein n=1 Tax=Nocardioides lacusdianchii TaxID=2783664 RepID=UPI001CCABF85|nr:hypothetical protein [Nocardioides lacusdianchii]